MYIFISSFTDLFIFCLSMNLLLFLLIEIFSLIFPLIDSLISNSINMFFLFSDVFILFIYLFLFCVFSIYHYFFIH